MFEGPVHLRSGFASIDKQAAERVYNLLSGQDQMGNKK